MAGERTNALSINGEPYRIVDQSRVGTGRRNYLETMRPSQPSESRLNTKTWTLSGPIGNSRQQVFGAPLGPDYTINLDGRNDGLLTSAAARNQVALTTIGAPAQFGVPISDVLKTSWNLGAGDATVAYDELDEGIVSGTPDDATSYWTSNSGTGDSANLTCRITSLSDPGTDIGFVARWRVRDTTAAEFIHLVLFQSTTAILNEYRKVSAADTWGTAGVREPDHAAEHGLVHDSEAAPDAGGGILQRPAPDPRRPDHRVRRASRVRPRD